MRTLKIGSPKSRLSLHPIHGGMMPRPIHVLVKCETLIFTSRDRVSINEVSLPFQKEAGVQRAAPAGRHVTLAASQENRPCVA